MTSTSQHGSKDSHLDKPEKIAASSHKAVGDSGIDSNGVDNGRATDKQSSNHPNNLSEPDTDNDNVAHDKTDKNTDKIRSAPPVSLFGKMLTFTRMKLTTNDLDEIAEQLQKLLGNKISQIPVVIDSEVEQDLAVLVELFWTWGLQPIGVVTGVLDEAAKAQRLAIFPSDGKRIERIRPIKQLENVEDLSADADFDQRRRAAITSTITAFVNLDTEGDSEGMTSMIYDQMLRSGQSINHVGGDLVLTNSVNNGAEVITDNSLHIYGRAQGRLVAGATGDKEARIFCQRFNPSLVSVAGTYCLPADIPDEVIDKPVQVRFEEGKGLVFDIMNNN